MSNSQQRDQQKLCVENIPVSLHEALLRASNSQKGIFFTEFSGEAHFLSYQALQKIARHRLNALLQSGIKSHDHVVLQIESLREYIITFWACIIGKIIPLTVTVPPIYDLDHAVVKKLLAVLPVVGAKAILTTSKMYAPVFELIEKTNLNHITVLPVDELPENNVSCFIEGIDGNDVAFLQLSSGSTGLPKIIPEIHRNVIWHSITSCEFNQYRPDERFLNWLPMDHVVPLLMCHCLCVINGFDQVLVSPQRVLTNPLAWLELLEHYCVTRTWAPNFAYKLVTEAIKQSPEKHFDLSHMRSFVNAGEQATQSVMKGFLERVKNFGIKADQLWIMYGMAEVSTAITCEHYHPEHSLLSYSHAVDENQEFAKGNSPDNKFLCVGKIFPDVEVRIVDSNQNALADGLVGRIQIRGPMLMPGYYKNPEANNVAFTSEGWFNSGDLGFLQGNRLTVTGREKELIIVYGANVYPYDIEDVINQIPDVLPTFVACTAVRYPDSVTDEIAVFYVPRGPSVNVSDHIVKRVAKYCNITISYVIPIEKSKFPKTTSGKIQRGTLRQQFERGEFNQIINAEPDPQQLCASVKITEQKIINYWKNLFKVANINPESDFFALGGNSLAAMQFLAEVESEFGLSLSFADLYQFSVLSFIANYVDQHKFEKKPDLLLKKKDSEAKVSHGQQRFRIWQSVFGKSNNAYNTSMGWLLKGSIQKEKIKKTIDLIVDRQMALTMNYTDDLESLQVVYRDKDKYHFEQINVELGGLDATLNYLAQLPFDLTSAPLFRVYLLVLTPEEAVLLFNWHHSIIDGWSVSIFAREFSELYTNPLMELPMLNFQYHDFSAWQRQQNFISDEVYWQYQLNDINISHFPKDKSGHLASKSKVARYPIELSEHYPKIKAITKELQISVFMLTISVLQYILGHYSGQEDVLVAATLAGRSRKEWQNIMGYFVNTVLIRNRLKPDWSVKEYLERTKTVVLEAFSHQNLPFDRVSELLQKKQGIALDGLVMFQVIPEYELPRVSDFSCKFLPEIAMTDAKFHFGMQLFDASHSQKLYGFIEYDASLYSHSYISELALCYSNVIREFTQELYHKLIQVEMLPRTKMLEVMNIHGSMLYPDWDKFWNKYQGINNVYQLIENRAHQDPLSVAIKYQQAEITYGDLVSEVSQLSAVLAEQYKLEKGNLIGICLPRNPRLIVTFLSMLKLGAVYVPLDINEANPGLLKKKINNAELNYIIVDSNSENVFAELGGSSLINLDNVDFSKAMERASVISATNAVDSAYIMYTSGTTGEPKGVICSHAGLIHWVAVQEYLLKVTREDSVYVAAPFTFDACTWEILLGLGHGASILLTPDTQRLELRNLSKLFAKHHITRATFTPSYLSLLSPEQFPSLKTITLTGEECPSDLAKVWLNAGVELYNGYGPTESCIGVSLKKLVPDQEINLGIAVPGKHMYVFDNNMKPQPIGALGEIYVSGPIAQGYWHDEALTKEKFQEITVLDRRMRAYKTGDLGIRLVNGEIQFMGRADRQIKLQGVRIELQAIEKSLTSIKDILNAVVIPVGNGTDKHLVAFLHCQKAQTESSHKILADRLLSAGFSMNSIPRKFIFLQTFPYDANGKVDLRKLSRLANERNHSGLEVAFATPGSLEEELVNIWKRVLKLESDTLIGTNDSFLTLGANSLLVTKMLNEVENKYQVPLSFSDFFALDQSHEEQQEAGTVTWLAKKIHHHKSSNHAQEYLSDLINKLMPK